MQGKDLSQEYRHAQAIARRITVEVGEPAFYSEKKKAVESSGRLFRENPLVTKAVSVLGADPDRIGHGLSHVTKVAVDAGAIILVERDNEESTDPVLRLVALVHVAGVLHDIKREEKEHARKGAEEAERILRDFDLSEAERFAIAGAIGNHEAFRPVPPPDDPAWKLLSDALYDADKFRWGPDNFSEMLWDMVSRRDVPLSKVLDRFHKGMEGVGRIRETFRSETGRYYGPDFIDRGMEIGRRLYAELTGGSGNR
jgi:hypothetical protein